MILSEHALKGNGKKMVKVKEFLSTLESATSWLISRFVGALAVFHDLDLLPFQKNVVCQFQNKV